MSKKRDSLYARAYGLLISVALAASSAIPVSAGETATASFETKVGAHGPLWEKLSINPSLKLPIIVQFTLPERPASTPAEFIKKEDVRSIGAQDEALRRSIHAAQDEILAVLDHRQGTSSSSAMHREIKRMDFSPMFAMAADAEEVSRLATHPNVVSIIEDVPASPSLTGTLPLIEMPQMYAAGFDGSGYTVAVLDSGVQASHKFLGGSVVSEACYNTTAAGGPNFSTSRCAGGASSATGAGSAADCSGVYGCGHGTVMSGIAAGFNISPQPGEPVSGVARGADILAINVMSLVDAASDNCPPAETSCLQAWTSDTVRGLERVYTLRNSLDIAAVALTQNSPLSSGPCNSDPRSPIIRLLRAERIATVISVGNDGDDTSVASPSCISSAIAVAASTDSDERATFSNWGPMVDLVAPGVNVVSSQASSSSDTAFVSSDGTSAAAAHVVGAIAALREAKPDATISEIENALKNTGVGIASAGHTKPRIRVNEARLALLSNVDQDPSAPVNNDFDESTMVAVPGSLSGSHVGADAEPGEPLHASVSSARNTVWWSYTPNQSGSITMTTQGSSIDTVMGVYTGSAVAALSTIAANDDNPSSGLWSAVTFSATAGTTYHVAVAGYSNGTGSITLTVSGGYVPPPSNDDFTDAALISTSGAVSGTNLYATEEVDEPVHAGVADARNSVWWTYTAVDNGTATIDTEGSAFDTVLAVYTGSALDSLEDVASNDDDESSGGWSQVSFPVSARTEYRIAIAGKSGAEGAITINLNEVPPPPPANDNFADAAPISTPGTVNGTNLYATEEADEPVHAAVADARNSVWWSYTPNQSGTVIIDTENSGFNTVLAVYSGSEIDDLVSIASNDNASSDDTWSRVAFEATAGIRYRIAVAGNGRAAGTIALSLQFIVAPPPAPTNDHFANATIIPAPGTVTGSTVGATAESGEPEHAGIADARKSVWWRYTPGETGTITLRTNGSSFDTVLAVYRGTEIDDLTPVASNDDSSSSATWSRVSFEAVAGVAYNIAIAGKAGAAGSAALTLQFAVAPPPGPLNDHFASSVHVSLPGTATGTNVNATEQASEPVHAGVADARNSVWWHFTSSQQAIVTIDTNGSSFDTVLAVYRGTTLGALNPVAANDNGGTGFTWSRVSFEAQPGIEYKIAVAGRGGAEGAISLTIQDAPPPVRPSNDNFADRIVIAPHGARFGPRWMTGSNTNATQEPGEPLHLYRTVATNSVWWRYTPATSGPITIDTRGSNFNTVLAVYQGGSVSNLRLVAWNDDADEGDIGRRSRVVFEGVAGRQYQIAVAGGYGNNSGYVRINLRGGGRYDPVSRPPNDNFANRIAIHPHGAIFGPRVVTADSTNATHEAGEPFHMNRASATKSVWWRYTPATSGPITIDTRGSKFNTVLAVYQGGSPSNLRLVAWNDDASATDRYSRVVVSGVAGEQYQIAVAGDYSSDSGAIRMTLRGGGRYGVASHRDVVVASSISPDPLTPPIGMEPIRAVADVPVGARSTYSQPTASLVRPPAFVNERAVETRAPASRAAPTASVFGTVATTGNDGVLRVPLGGSNFAALAIKYSGPATTLTADLAASSDEDINLTNHLRDASICRTDMQTGACIETSGPSVSFHAKQGELLSFMVVVRHEGAEVPYDPENRIDVRFHRDEEIMGMASFPVCTAGATACEFLIDETVRWMANE